MYVRWIDLAIQSGNTSRQHIYHCAQNATHQQKPKKREDPKKRHKQDSKVAFKCDGWLHLTLSDLSDLLSFFSRVSKNVKNTCVCGSTPLLDPLCSFLLAECMSHGHELWWRSPWLSSWILSTLLDNSVPFGTGATDCTPRTVGAIAIQEWHSG